MYPTLIRTHYGYPLALYERVTRKNTIPRAVELTILFLLLSLVAYRLISLQDHGFTWFLASVCESWFAFTWVLSVSTKWTQADYKTYPEHLLQGKPELPAVDMFVTTADPVLEPPILTVNTVLSLLAVDYPANKLACYVSDDGGSPLTFYSLMEASKFAKLWVPFCKKYCIEVRAPFRYFSGESSLSRDVSLEFQQEWKKMKTRVSGVMSNAPFMMNVDCDMYINNPKIFLHAMCLLLGAKNKDTDFAYVQSPQCFYDGLKDDPFGNQFVVLFEYLGRGIVGIQGPFYGGTGCFHKRKVIYGLSPNDEEIKEKLSNQALQKTFGGSMEFTKSAGQILSSMKTSSPHELLSSLEAAKQVAGCSYEYGTLWGREVGWIYGSTTEDVLAGLTIHGRGWKSAYCSPNPPAFLGCAPSGGPAIMTQQKRWATGLLEILFSRRSPFFLALQGKLQFRQCLAYLWLMLWGLRSIPELCYAILPAYCIITSSHFLPKVGEAAFFIAAAVFITYNLYTLSEYLRAGLSVRAWWNNQRMWRINTTTAWLIGTFSVVLKILGISDTVFEVTPKEQSTNEDDDHNANAGRLTFDRSPIFIAGTTILLVNLTALAVRLLGLGFGLVAHGKDGPGIGEVICSVWVVLLYWAFFRGLFGKGKYGIPSSTLYKAGALAALFVHFSRWTSMG
ncbi:cellulose synthase-like protein H2 isoform X3 [Actinidia eriantha]|uniref:cellulose synthase-like protein H2 isoform X3 n=1 Tax=Actinidia eriantha TaxID=165200 RepID=UPI002589334E|nr:cellulose synthase-like protein H2 isoform X3 [Actinidia eriantha]